MAKIYGARDILGNREISNRLTGFTEGETASFPEPGETCRLCLGNTDRAGVGEQMGFCIGKAIEHLKNLESEGISFDFIFIDADKRFVWPVPEAPTTFFGKKGP